jgi:hypothetical protein
MHIGGESNSAQSKRPWLSDIEREGDAILLCYRHVQVPGQVGSFGLDLYVGVDGGRGEIKGMRQKIGGEAFERCMQQAFSSIDFHRPERPTMLSYSLLFEFDSDS